MAAPRYAFDINRLRTGQVLVAGGLSAGFQQLAVAELFDEASGTWSVTGYMSTVRSYAASALLLDGSVLICGGGVEESGVNNAAEIYSPCGGRGHAPVAVCASRVVSAGPTCSADASVNGGSFDPDSGPGSLALTQAPSGPYPLGSTPVTLTASDGSASATCSATVTVVDDGAPAITCPPPRVMECQGGGASGSFTAGATDNCSVSQVSCPLSGQRLPLGVTAVTCTAADGSGNQASCQFPVTVVDSKPPVAGASRGLVLWPPDHQLRRVSLSDCAEDAVDACEGTLSLAEHGRIVQVTSDEPGGCTGQDAIIVGPTAVDLRAEREGRSDGRVYTILYTVADSSGRSTSASCTVTVPHDRSRRSRVMEDRPRRSASSGAGSGPSAR
jgi:hypothetical protein